MGPRGDRSGGLLATGRRRSCLAANPAGGCNDKAGPAGHIAGEVISVAEMDSANRTAIEIAVVASDLAPADRATVWMEGGWRIPEEFRSAGIHTQIRMAAPTRVTDLEDGA